MDEQHFELVTDGAMEQDPGAGRGHRGDGTGYYAPRLSCGRPVSAGARADRFRPGGPPGLVLGFGGLPEPAIEQGIRLVAEALEPATGDRRT
jgi:hypothetical protein